jgi:hypothetical protein
MKPKPKTWTPTKVQQLYRHSSRTFYARMKVGGKPLAQPSCGRRMGPAHTGQNEWMGGWAPFNLNRKKFWHRPSEDSA